MRVNNVFKYFGTYAGQRNSAIIHWRVPIAGFEKWNNPIWEDFDSSEVATI